MKPEQHAAAMEFFGAHNPQPRELLKTNPKRIKVGIVKIDKPKDQFVDLFLKAATRQLKDLGASILVVQQGSVEMDDPSTTKFYLIGALLADQSPVSLFLNLAHRLSWNDDSDRNVVWSPRECNGCWIGSQAVGIRLLQLLANG